MDESQIQKSPEGKEEKTPTETTPQTQTTQYQQLKEENDKYEQELTRGRALLKEAQEIEAKRMLGGGTNAGEAKLTPEEEKAQKAKEEADNIVKAFK